MADETLFPFAQVAQAPTAQPFVTPSAAPPTPQTIGMAAVNPATSPPPPPQPGAGDLNARVAERVDAAVPSWSDNPVGRFGFVLGNIAAGLAGRPLPSQQIYQRAVEMEAQADRNIGSQIAALNEAATAVRRVPEADRERVITEMERRYGRAIPAFGDLIRGALSNENDSAVLELFNDHRQIMAPIVRMLGVDGAIALARDSNFATRLNASADARNRPIVAARLQEIRAAIRSGAGAGILPREWGNRAITLPQFEALMARVPENSPFHMTPDQMGTLRRSNDMMLSAGITPPTQQADVARAGAVAGASAAATAAVARRNERPESEIIEEGGQRFRRFFNPRTGQELSRLPAGDPQGGLMETLLRRDPSTLNDQERAYLEAQLSRGSRRTTIDPATGQITMEEGAAATAPRSPEFERLRNQEASTQTAIGLIDRMDEQLRGGSVTTGLVGVGVRAVNSIGDQLAQLAETLTPQQRTQLNGYISRAESLLPNVSAGSATESARFRSNLITLAYAVARARDPRGQVTQRDFDATLQSFGTGEFLSSRDQMRAALDEVRSGMRTNYRNQHDVTMRGLPEGQRREVPEWAREPQRSGVTAPAPAGQGGGAGRFRAMTPAELGRIDTGSLTPAELDAWRARVDELRGTGRR